MQKKILVIDDDRDILEALHDLLELEGYTVEINPKADTAIESAINFHPDIILLDLLLSGRDGASICKEIRATEEIHDIPVIMMSAHPYAQKAIAGAGANEFLRKPFDVEQLLTLLKTYIPS